MSAAGAYTIDDARAILARSLCFGDLDQIGAVEYIVTIERCADALKMCRALGHEQVEQCETCKGEGFCRHCEQECADCYGSGKSDDRDCDCLDAYEPQEIREAIDLLDKPYTLGGMFPALAKAAEVSR